MPSFFARHRLRNHWMFYLSKCYREKRRKRKEIKGKTFLVKYFIREIMTSGGLMGNQVNLIITTNFIAVLLGRGSYRQEIYAAGNTGHDCDICWYIRTLRHTIYLSIYLSMCLNVWETKEKEYAHTNTDTHTHTYMYIYSRVTLFNSTHTYQCVWIITWIKREVGRLQLLQL